MDDKHKLRAVASRLGAGPLLVLATIASIGLTLFPIPGNTQQAEPSVPESPSGPPAFVREADKGAAIRDALAGRTLHYRNFGTTPKHRETPFCGRLLMALRGNRGIRYVEPVFTTEDPNDPRLAKYNERCADAWPEEGYVSEPTKHFTGVGEMIGQKSLKVFRLDVDNNPANGIEEFVYGEPLHDRRHRKVIGAHYSRVDLKQCLFVDGAPVKWPREHFAGLSAIIRFEKRHYILSLGAYSPTFASDFHLDLWSFKANRKRSSDSIPCTWSTFKPL